MASITQILAFSSTKIHNGPFFKWEAQNGGLGTVTTPTLWSRSRPRPKFILTPPAEHKCAVCHTVLSSPRAKKSCFGIHEVVCPSYHGTLHRAGAEHKCDACRMSSEQHLERIREIATVDHHAQDRNTDRPTTPSHRRKGSHAWGPVDTLDGSSMKPPDSPTTARSGPGVEEPSSPGAMFSVNKKDKKAEQSARRAKAHASRLVTADEVARWEAALHPPAPERSGAEAATIAAALTYTPQLFACSAIKQDSVAKKAARRNTLSNAGAVSSRATKAAIIDTLLAKLEIGEQTARYAGKEGRALLAKLRGLVEAHLTVGANEERYRMQRMEGYWRYVNRRAYNRMVRKGELWDCGTGGRLVELEEGEGESGDGEAEGDGEGGAEADEMEGVEAGTEEGVAAEV